MYYSNQSINVVYALPSPRRIAVSSVYIYFTEILCLCVYVCVMCRTYMRVYLGKRLVPVRPKLLFLDARADGARVRHNSPREKNHKN